MIKTPITFSKLTKTTPILFRFKPFWKVCNLHIRTYMHILLRPAISEVFLPVISITNYVYQCDKKHDLWLACMCIFEFSITKENCWFVIPISHRRFASTATRRDCLRRSTTRCEHPITTIADRRRPSWTGFATIQHVESWAMQIGGVNTPTTRRDAIPSYFLTNQKQCI